MMKRRDFMKSILCGGILLAAGHSRHVIDEVNAFINLPERKKAKSDRTIFCIVDDPALQHALKKCAQELDCDILFDRPDSPDLMYDHYFAAVVDGSVINKGAWDMYVDLCNEGNMTVPCLMVGDAGHLRMPGAGNVYRFDVNGGNGYGDVLGAIREIKARMNGSHAG
jgi:hypothetical protein